MISISETLAEPQMQVVILRGVTGLRGSNI